MAYIINTVVIKRLGLSGRFDFKSSLINIMICIVTLIIIYLIEYLAKM